MNGAQNVQIVEADGGPGIRLGKWGGKGGTWDRHSSAVSGPLMQNWRELGRKKAELSIPEGVQHFKGLFRSSSVSMPEDH